MKFKALLAAVVLTTACATTNNTIEYMRPQRTTQYFAESYLNVLNETFSNSTVEINDTATVFSSKFKVYSFLEYNVKIIDKAPYGNTSRANLGEEDRIIITQKSTWKDNEKITKLTQKGGTFPSKGDKLYAFTGDWEQSIVLSENNYPQYFESIKHFVCNVSESLESKKRINEKINFLKSYVR